MIAETAAGTETTRYETDLAVSFVTVAWNCAGELAQLLASLRSHIDRPYEVVVVDNDSDDDVAGVVATDPAARLHAMGRNAGFGAANNVGVRLARAPVVILINPDCYAIDGSLEALIDVAGTSGELCGPRLLNPDRTIQPSASPRPAGWEMLALALVPGRALPRPIRHRCEPWSAPRTISAYWLTAACIAARRDVLMALGPFDPAIHLYSEDLDLGIRAARAGVKCRFAGEVAQLVHIRDASSAQRFDDRGLLLTLQNRASVVATRLGRSRAVTDLLLQTVTAVHRLVLKRALGRPAPHELASLRVFRRALPYTMRTARTDEAHPVMVFHLAEMSGPARSMRDRFERSFPDVGRHIIVPGEGPVAALYGDVAEVHVLDYERLTLPSSLLAAASQAFRFGRDVRMFRGAFRKLGAGPVIAATTATPAAAVAARMSGRGLIVYCGELFDKRYVKNPARRWLGRALAAAYVRLADAIVCCSDAVAAQFAHDRRARVSRIYPSVARRTIPDDVTGPPVVLAVGTITPARGQDVLVRAFARLANARTDARLVIAGEPTGARRDREFRSALVEEIERLDLVTRVTLVGHVDDVDALYGEASVVVNPARFAEPFGRVAFEALAAGRPVVSTDTGAVRELLSHRENALLVPPDDVTALAAAVDELLEHPELGQRLVAGAAAALEELDPALGVVELRKVADQVRAARGRSEAA